MIFALCIFATITVIDGDMIRVGAERIRLLGFDAPETCFAKCKREAALGSKATENLRQLLKSKCVTIVRTRKDRYRRTLAHVFVNGENIAKIAIREKWGRPYYGGKRMPWCKSDDR